MNRELTYQGKAYPVDYQRKVLGELTDSEIERYGGMVNDELRENICGLWNNIFFVEKEAIRYVGKKSIFKLSKKEKVNVCLKNLLIGNHLRDNKIGAPKMKAVYWGNESSIAFLVMEKLNLEEFNSLNSEERKKKLKKEKEKINSLGYVLSDDVWEGQNFGYDLVSEKSVFFDFDHWKTSNGIIIPKLNARGVIV